MSNCGEPAVTFNYANWVLRYPEFAVVPQPLAQLYFDEATIYCRNKLGPVPTIPVLTQLLNMLTSHIAQLNAPGTDPGAPVGRLSDVTEGSVSASFENDYPPGSAQWFQQTKYGAAYWQATLAFRLFRYKTAPVAGGPASWGGLPWLNSLP